MRTFPFLLLLASFLFAPHTHAQAVPIQVTATVPGTCELAPVSGVDFGAVGSIPVGRVWSRNISIRCSTGVAWSIRLDQGLWYNFDRRRARTPGGQFLQYRVHRNATDTTASSAVVDQNNPFSGTGNGAWQDVTLFFRTVNVAVSTPGNYTDTITATLVF